MNHGTRNNNASLQERLQPVIDAAWSSYDALMHEPYVVTPSLPILFFGDSERCSRSPIKIITVGLNPSQHEFPSPEPFHRFRAAALRSPVTTKSHAAAYLAALNNYFRSDPYRQWFRAFEPILNGLDASYYDGYTNTALNTDFCSPIATAPTWSKLTANQQATLMHTGVELWHQLVAEIEPDIVIMSVVRRHLTRLLFRIEEPWQPIYSVEQRIDGSTKRMPYHVYATIMQINRGRQALVVFGRAAHTPFGLITNTAKHDIGARIRKVWTNRAQRTTQQGT